MRVQVCGCVFTH